MTLDTARQLLSRPTITVDQFAEIFGISRAGAYQAVARGEVASTRVGSTIRVLTQPLAAMLGLQSEVRA